MNNHKTIHDLLKSWGDSKHQLPRNNEKLKSEILSKVPVEPTLTLSKTYPQRSPYMMWLSGAFTVAAVAVMLVNVGGRPADIYPPIDTSGTFKEVDTFAISPATAPQNEMFMTKRVSPTEDINSVESVASVENESTPSAWMNFWSFFDAYVPGPLLAWLFLLAAIVSYLLYRKTVRINYDY